MADYRLTPDAESDLEEIARYTLSTWGEQQQRLYETAIATCFADLAAGTAFTRKPLAHRPDVLQVRCEHHVVFALETPNEPLTIVAILHERMDLMTRLQKRLQHDGA